MCLLICAVNSVPPEEYLTRAADQNGDGAGIAWIEGSQIRFHKGLEVDEVISYTGKLKLPYMIHFRAATAGGRAPGLTHPFPITKSSDLSLRGTAPSVLGHNGHWWKWQDDLKLLLAARGHKWPMGPVSDSRAMAICTYILGPEFLNHVDEKVAVLSPKGFRIFNQPKFTEIDGVWYSYDPKPYQRYTQTNYAGSSGVGNWSPRGGFRSTDSREYTTYNEYFDERRGDNVSTKLVSDDPENESAMEDAIAEWAMNAGVYGSLTGEGEEAIDAADLASMYE